MKKSTNKKVIISILMALTLVFGCVSPAFAESADTADTDVSTDTDTELFEAIDTDIILSTDTDVSDVNSSTLYSASVNLSSSAYNNITGSSTTLGVTLTITNSTGNSSGVLFRAINSSGSVVASPVGIYPGNSGTLKIPAGTGNYTVQGKAVGASGYYSITITK